MIVLKNIQKNFGKQRVLKGVDLEIPDKKITVILGQSGQGKSVLLKILIGLIEQDGGTIMVDGVNVGKLSERERTEFCKRFGVLFQGAALFDSMTVGENVAFPLREHTDYSDATIREMVQKKLRDLGLPGIMHKMPSELSGGMRKRVGLARALMMEPEIILYDEPTTGLDPLLTDSVDNLIVATGKSLGVTSVVVSHDVQAALRIADKLALLNEGRILEEGTPEDFRQSKKPFVQQFILGKAGKDYIG
ncbi:MAG: ABC transporter ATP-binding protein [bacterium]|nr:ABC transporter ATP-binding protein [bacterium]